MTELSPLITALTATCDWHGARIAFVSQFLVALIRVRTVNLTEIATAFCGETTSNSHYRRIQRVFKDFPLTRAHVAVAVVQWLPLGQQWLLCLDRTNWKFGTMDINILVLAVAIRGWRFRSCGSFWTNVAIQIHSSELVFFDMFS